MFVTAVPAPSQPLGRRWFRLPSQPATSHSSAVTARAITAGAVTAAAVTRAARHSRFHRTRCARGIAARQRGDRRGRPDAESHPPRGFVADRAVQRTRWRRGAVDRAPRQVRKHRPARATASTPRISTSSSAPAGTESTTTASGASSSSGQQQPFLAAEELHDENLGHVHDARARQLERHGVMSGRNWQGAPERTGASLRPTRPGSSCGRVTVSM